jgi:hypothetical protein
MDITKDCFLDMDIDERTEAYFTGEKVENWKTVRRKRARFFTKNTQKVVREEMKQPVRRLAENKM